MSTTFGAPIRAIKRPATGGPITPPSVKPSVSRALAVSRRAAGTSAGTIAGPPASVIILRQP